MEKNWHIFSDFDGTIAMNDVGAQLFINYGDQEKCRTAVDDWMVGSISSCEMYRRECATAAVTTEQLIELAHQQKIDPYFLEFYQLCSRKKYDTTILSDGFEIYIHYILEKYNISNLEVRANDIRFLNGTQITPVFPYNEHSCGRCANCKGYHIRQFRKKHPQTQVILIGDGFSDRCGAEEADIVFAKDDLLQYCQNQNLTYTSFENFADVIESCKKLRILD
ncbi:MAG: hypothetical protein DWQ05_03985 [Calditrichaeota bacterium]|nr:MAG: hypothetical protein DWQ05_03985 [Calditrichota bacterium]